MNEIDLSCTKSDKNITSGKEENKVNYREDSLLIEQDLLFFVNFKSVSNQPNEIYYNL